MSTYNPFDNQLFRDEFEKTLDRKLGPLVDKVDEHETYIQQQRGGGRFMHYLFTLIVAAFSGLFAGWLKGK